VPLEATACNHMSSPTPLHPLVPYLRRQFPRRFHCLPHAGRARQCRWYVRSIALPSVPLYRLILDPISLLARTLKGNDIPTLLDAIMQLLPLDETAPPAMVMGMVSTLIISLQSFPSL